MYLGTSPGTTQIEVIRSLRLKTSPLVGRPPVVIDAGFIGNSLRIARGVL